MKSIINGAQAKMKSVDVEVLVVFLSQFRIHLIVIALALLSFSSCNKVKMSALDEKASGQNAGLGSEDSPEQPTEQPPELLPPPQICNGTSCDLDPLTSKAAVTLILLALGDQANQQLVINGASSQLIAETVVRYTTPVTNPKILVVQDYNIHGEDPEDTQHLVNVLLQRYNVTYLEESESGLHDSDLAGYDLVWFNNPGHPMSSSVTLETLKRFKGGLVLQGDDLSRGSGFSVESLTKVKHIANGTSASCGSQSYSIDNNTGKQYLVEMSPQYFPTGSNSILSFNYGNDIDQVEILSSSVQVLASARVDMAGCADERPAILRYFNE